MNQIELNKIAMSFLMSQSAEVASKIREFLHKDAQERADQMVGRPLHYIHNMALFECLVYLNSFFTIENNSREAVKEYAKYAETLRPRFLDIMESLRDFEPTVGNTKDNESDN